MSNYFNQLKKLLCVIMVAVFMKINAQDPNLIFTLVSLTTTQMNSITPPLGAMIFNSTENAIFQYSGSWEQIPVDNSTWSTSGNSGTNPTTDFIGTADGQDLIFKANNLEAFRVSQVNQRVGINTINPNAQLDILSTEVPLRIQPNAATPAGSLSGQMFVANDGLLYAYDAVRTKWLSIDRTMFGWGRNDANTTDEYLRQYNGALSNNNGWRMIRDGTITAITVQTDAAESCTIEIRKNDTTTIVSSLTLTNEEGRHDNTINIDFNEGDFLQCFLNGTDINFPQVLIEIAWRK
ncbi:hypothetical protein [Spongiivirga citrea]|uniref:Uncharacterized protein n=1 Tax=Spongiivirga citrea TaxID=1481457 RepID=A0A6M0CLS6_9FLAO|nr:hypothetical protein [Spongiivirga citrea]NER18612.1 hypothetical protein [Spongiivirga citrea]